MDKESESLVREWLAEYKSLPESSIPNYAESILKRDDVLDSLMKLFKSSASKEERRDDLTQPVCHQLFEFYRSGFPDLKYFTMNLFPSIILSHIVTASNDSTSTDALLLSVYALSSENSLESGLEIPQLGYPSIYHDPMSGIFSEQMLNNQASGRRIYQKPILPNHQVIIPSNRFKILTRVLNVYFEHISMMKKKSHVNLCESCKFLASSGYQWRDKYLENSEKVPNCRYSLSVDFMLRMLRCVYFTLYNHCWSESRKATEAMQRRARKEMIPQILFLCNAILNSAEEQTIEAKTGESGEAPPYGLSSVNLTPMLTRESSRRGGRYAATAKSIKDHKWRHHNEEISGDLSRSLANSEIQPHPPKLGQDFEEAGKAEKYSSTSPSKLLKTKLKKSAAAASPGNTDKSKMPAPSTGEKRNKKHSMDKSGEEIELEKIKRSPSQRKDTPTKSSSKVILKHPSMDEASLTPKLKGVSISKSASDVARSSISGKLPHQSSSAGEDSDLSSVPFIDGHKHDTTASSESESRESYPLLKNLDSPSRSKTTVQTAF